MYNSGNVECTLAGFQLDDSEELEDFTFGYIILAPGDYWFGYEDAEDSFSSGLDADGDNVVFADADGNMLTIIVEVSIEIEGVALSQSYGSDGVGCYTMPSEGYTNELCVGCMPGDLSNDSNLNVLDIVILSGCILSGNCDDQEPDVCISLGISAGDLNDDSIYNVLDIVVLANCILDPECLERVDDASKSTLIMKNEFVSIGSFFVIK